MPTAGLWVVRKRQVKSVLMHKYDAAFVNQLSQTPLPET